MPTEDDAQHERATEDGTVDCATKSPVDDHDEIDDGVADELLGEDSQEVSFDLFESGNIWSQVQSTQLHREAWRRGINPRSDDDDRYGETANIFPRPVTSTDEAVLNNVDAHSSSFDENAEPQQSAMPTATATAAQTDPWWRQGKTAPLLDQFDEQRRVWYLAQAGVYDHDKFVHDAQGIPADVGDDDDEDDIIIISPDAATSSRTPNARRLHPMVAAVTPLPRTAGLQRAALTLAGNVNSPLAPAARAALQTPKRKTWQSTLAQKEESRLAAAAAAAAATSSAKKRRQSAGGSGSTARTAASRTTTPRGRGTGRSFAPRSAPRTTTPAGRKST